MHREKHPWIYDLLFLLVLLLAGYLRLTGVNWGEGQHQHPDENHFTSVLENLRAHKCLDASIPVDVCPEDQQRWLSVGDYFDSKTSTLNQYNRGFGFYVYGNLPMTIVRIAAEATNQTNLKIFARQFSALADLFTIFFLYLIVSRLYGRKVALLASLFSALTVMQIQQSHFFTVDLFTNAFAFLAIYFAVKILTRDFGSENSQILQSPISNLRSLLTNPFLRLSIGFGFAFGMALASKVNIYPLAVLLPGAFVLRYFIADRHALISPLPEGEGQGQGEIVYRPRSLITDYWSLIIACLIIGGLAALISFRIFQPYAFDGWMPSEQWVRNIQEQRIQAKGDADLPWNLQWVRRSHLYSFTNLTVWGLGLPLGILAWAGFLYMGWRILKGEWRHALLWGWTAAYFLWQSLQFNPTMRYQLPIYPLLAMMAAWVVFEPIRNMQYAIRTTYYVLRTIITVIVVLLTAAWAFAFHSIYLREEPRIAASRWIYQNVPGPINLRIQTNGSEYNQPMPFPIGGFIQEGIPYDTTFVAQRDGILRGVTLGHVKNLIASPSTLSLTLSETPNPTPAQILASASLTADFSSQNDPRGDAYTLVFDRSISVAKGQQYYLRLETDAGSLLIEGAAVTNETDYDYGLPFRLDGYDAFGGIYRGDLNLQVYWDDNEDKLARFVDTLTQTDYIFIPTNHQYAQITRVPERYPLTTLYYRELMGCPISADIIKCYYEAKPGDYEGRLGFDLVAVFETFPRLELPLLGRIEINDQYAEEAFTFYDHPKVLIFGKNERFSAEQVRSILGAVDLTKVVRLTPRQFDDYSSLLLPADRLASQRAGGTWSELFSYQSLQNRYPVLGLLLWYFFIFVLGLAVYPWIRLAMPGLADKGYPLSRALGLVLLGYLAWMGGSLGIPYIRGTIAIVFGVILLIGIVLAYYQRDELREEWKSKRKYFFLAEGLFLAFFLIDLLIRLGNPDLWHPSFGGERPMDFSYFNAVIRSTSFPPYDPWFAGGHINYYYYGFVLVGTPVKLLGIVPSIAYNFILPTLFAFVGICAFSLGWNLIAGSRSKVESPEDSSNPPTFNSQRSNLPLISGLSASFLALLLGNLGTIQMLYNKLQQLGAAGSFEWESTFMQRSMWALQGLVMIFKGASLSISTGDWYWLPSRVVPPRGGNEITEFPLFTFLYSDLHAHMIAMPLALLALSWALAVVAGRARWRNQLSAVSGFAVGGLIIGALYPSNLSDIYTYLPIGLAAAGYAIWRYAEASSTGKRIALVLGAVSALTVLSFVMYQPYRAWYSQAYSALDLWKGPFTPLSSYLTHWLVLLFIIVSWMVWETREWMAETPLSALRKLKPYQLLIEGALVLLVLALLVLQYHGTSVGWIALPLASWAGVLLLRPNMSDAKRFVLFLIGTALLITIVVEVVVVRGDIGRQNTIFKFYLQAWFLLAVSGGAALAWTLPAFFKWLPGWRVFWQSAMILLLAGAALFTVTGTSGKIRDRWIREAPRTLDSMTFMRYAHYDDFGRRLDLSEDYRAIRWMQDNVQGSPVIVEANCPEYRWCTRFTIYTGLPGVVGWNWHQRQQRVYTSMWVQDRVNEVGDFYNDIDMDHTLEFLRKYEVKYIIVGQLERAAYAFEGISKFERYDGVHWRSVYRDGQTIIYEVLP
jgi:YYY domain-containing protein